VAEGETISNKDPEPEETEGAEVGAGAEGAGEESNRLMISLAALREGTGAEEVAGSLELDPKISARRSWVDGPDDAPLEDGVTVVSLSPMRSTIESLSVLVEPTGLRSLTGCQLARGRCMGSLPVPIIVALISGGGILSITPALISFFVNRLPNSTDLC